MKKLEVFISGETIDLCTPTREFAQKSKWYTWFNNPEITRYLGERGEYRNTPALQEKFFLSEPKKRLILIITTKEKVYKGVVSLSFINYKKRTCDIAIVTDFLIEPQYSPYASLEAIARITQHGFDKMGMKRISGGAHINLRNWQQRMELFGYRIESVNRNSFIKGKEVSNSMTISCLHDDYLSIIKNRGKLWDNLRKMKKRIDKLPKKTFRDQLLNFFNSNGSKYYKKLFKL
jgi:RimJ/RimL family protein N-acetyltransferase